MRDLRPCRPTLLLVVALLLGVLAACSDAVDDPGPAAPDALRWEGPSEVELDGTELVVGSKEPAAQRVLGWIAVEALRSTGADVTDEINLGGTGANREAMLAGLIDLYWEYPAVGWTAILQRTDPETDAAELYDEVRARDLEENDVTWLPPAPAELGYGLVAAPETLAAEDVGGVDDAAAALEERPDELTLCVDEQDPFVADADGLTRLRDATGLTLLAADVLTVPADDLYDLLEPGSFCTFAAVRLGEPAIAESGVAVLEGDQVFLPLRPSVTVRADVLGDVPEIEDVLEPISEAMTTEQLRALTASVEQDGEEPRDVAREWLVSEGFAVERSTDEGSEG